MGLILNGSAAASPICIAYYCSGHGYGHATRVSAFARTILSLSTERRPIAVHIVSSAPEHVFADSIGQGARYRHAEIDPVIVQPLAYQVDRRKSLAVLKSFLGKKQALLERETRWLHEVGVTVVLSDAAFLGCLAAKVAQIPSILVTNFSFDSVYSYLATSIVDSPDTNLHPDGFESLLDDEPIPLDHLEPLVKEMHSGYRCADLLVLLPGSIPIPSFFGYPSLPASTWVDCETKRFYPDIVNALVRKMENSDITPIPFPTSGYTIPRKVIPAPLLVRDPSPDWCTFEGRSRILTQIGIPAERQGFDTKVLVVSFGGQHFHQPSRSGSRADSRSSSREKLPGVVHSKEPGPSFPATTQQSQPSPPSLTPSNPPRLATESHIWVPGAPPAYKGVGLSPVTTPGSPPTRLVSVETAYFDSMNAVISDYEPRLLPDESWIAVVCGVSKEKWLMQGEDLPDRFYVAPKDIYMPDLTSIADVLLGKLGYGTVSECVDACTPCVYVSRPLFVEEHGLRLLLEREGVGVELARSSYEAGDWASAISEAFSRGKPMKERKQIRDCCDRANQTLRLAKDVIDWATDCSRNVRAAAESHSLGDK